METSNNSEDLQIMSQAPSRLDARLAACARTVVDAQISIAADNYVRTRDLPRLMPRIAKSVTSDREVVRWLKKALRRERARALTGHWSYDAGRHMMLRAALRRESAAKGKIEHTITDRAGIMEQ